MRDIPDNIKKLVVLVEKDGIIAVSRINHTEKQCEYCDELVVNRTENITINRTQQSGVLRRRCNTCKLYYNTYDKQFNLHEGDEWRAYVKRVKKQKV